MILVGLTRITYFIPALLKGSLNITGSIVVPTFIGASFYYHMLLVAFWIGSYILTFDFPHPCHASLISDPWSLGRVLGAMNSTSHTRWLVEATNTQATTKDPSEA